MNSVKDIINGVLDSQEYFKHAIFTDDVEQYAMMIDDLPELPSIGVYFNDSSRTDWQGAPLISCELTFFHSRDMMSDAPDADTMQAFTTAVNDFLQSLSPYIRQTPRDGRVFKDSVIYGVTYSIEVILTKVCIPPTPPTPPDPRMGYYEYLEAYSGTNNYNIWVLTHITNFAGLRVTIRGYTTMASSQSPTVWFQRIGAYSRTDPNNVPSSIVYDFTYNYVNNSLAIRNAETQQQVYTADMSIKYGTTRYNGFYGLWYGRNASNISYGRIYSIKVERDGKLIYDMRPYVDRNGVTGLKDVVTGEFFTPQQNVSITAVNKL
jgi:hypothetical protein